MSIWNRIVGGWRTWGPGSGSTPGAFATESGDSPFDAVSASEALKIGAVLACLERRAETMGSLPLHLRDGKKNLIKDHDLYNVLHSSPNAMQTAPEYWSMQTANVDMHGNSLSLVRRAASKRVISLEPFPWDCGAQILQRKTGAYYYDIGGDKYEPEDILHLKGLTLEGFWGIGRLAMGRRILSAQLTANDSAMRGFKQALKVGGFFELEHNLTTEQRNDFNKILDQHSLPENQSKWLALFKGMKPVGGAQFRIKPQEAELLGSRYFGVEEICRLFNVPPQLIGHTDKASSWASSIEQINLHFLMYSLQPTFVRAEGRIAKTLLSPYDRAKGLEAKFSIQGLLRADLQTRQAFYASALQNGYYNRNEVRDLEERPPIDGGEEYTVQTNMTSADNVGGNNTQGKKP